MNDIVKQLEAALKDTTDLRTKIDLQNDLAWELRDTDPERSRTLSETAYQLATSDPFGEQVYSNGAIKSLRGLAHSNRRAGNLSLSLSQSMQALGYLERASLPSAEADVLQSIAITLGSLGNYAEGLEYGFKALNLAQSIGDSERVAHILSSIGVIYTHSKNIKEALNMFRQALHLNRELGRKRYEGQTLNNMSIAYRALGEYDQALETSLQALQIAEETEFSGLIVTAKGTAGEACLAMGEYIQASHYLQQYLTAARSAGSKRDETWALTLLGETDLRQGRVASVFAYLSQALDMARQVGLRSEEARCYELMAEMYEKQGNLQQALAQLKLFHQIKEAIFNEDTANRIANLQVIHEVEKAKRDAKIQYLKTIELQRALEESKKSESTLEKLAAIDPLTGVPNRREFFVLAEREVQSALQGQKPLSTILVDFDHFKEINDSQGHSIGDQVLTAAAQVIKNNLRQGEILGRIGGDEFSILAPGSDWLQAQKIARRLQEKIVSHSFETNQGTISLTASLGVAELDRERGESLGELLDHADQAMYLAKRAGGNCITTYQKG